MITNTISSAIRTLYVALAASYSLPAQYDNDTTEISFSKCVNLGLGFLVQLTSRMTILDGEERQMDVGNPGNNLYRTTAILSVQLFAPIGDGDANLRLMSKIIIDYFKGELAGVHFRPGTISNVGIMNGKKQFNLNIPFYYDERK